MSTAVIIPIHNRERQLPVALASLSAQTDQNFIAVCVDDGSTDGSAGVLRRCQREASFPMRIISQENAGVSAARNAGLTMALECADVNSVMFLDADDSYAPTCVEEARRLVEDRPNAIGSFAILMDDGKVIDGVDSPSVCNKIYPRTFVAAVRFCEQSNIAEDLAFNLEIRHRFHPETAHVSKPLYRYAQVVDSTMHRPLALRDFHRRVAILEHLVSVFSDDESALDSVCRDEIPELLKQFWRDLKRVRAADKSAVGLLFASELRSLRRRGLLHPNRRNFKDLKYYIRFLFA